MTATAPERQRRSVPSRRRRQVLIAASVAIIAPAILSLLFLLPTHNPTPYGLPVAIAGTGEQATKMASELRDGGFDVRRVSATRDAEDAILNRDAYGAFVFTA